MRRPPVLASRTGSARRQSVSVVLGADHPLARSVDAVEAVWGQWRAVAAVLTGSSVAVVEGRRWAVALTASAAIVLFGLTAVTLVQRSRRRDRALDLIIEGHEDLPVAAVQAERERLLADRTRRGLAASLEAVVTQASSRRTTRMAVLVPLFDVRVVRCVESDLQEVSRLLLIEPASARGVAVAERLITHGVSPLYGQEVEPLRDELRRLHDLLGG